MSVKQAQREIDSREFAAWVAYDRIEPIGDDRRDVMEARTAMTIAAVFGGGRNLRLAEFLPFAREAKREQTPADIEATFGRFAKAHNKAVKRNRKAKDRKAR